VPSVKRTLSSIEHSRSFKDIIIGVGRNPERNVVRYNNVVLIFETYEDIATAKLQIRLFQPPHSGLTTVVGEVFEYLQIIYIARN